MVIIMRKKGLIFLSLIAYVTLIIGLVKIKVYKAEQVDSAFSKIQLNEQIDAKAAVVLDAKTLAILYEKNANVKMLPASITKILTCITALETYKLDDYVYITEEMVNTLGSKIYLMPGDYVKVENLLLGLMLNSGNDAAKSLALHLSGKEEDYIALMNKLAQRIGMKNSVFNNPSGLDDDTCNYTTAFDMAILTAYALNNNDFKRIFSTKAKVVEQENHYLYLHHKHKLVQSCDYVIGGKTGYTKKAGRTLVTTYKIDDREVIVVTLDAHNDWQIHQMFYQKCKNQTIEILSVIVPKPFSKRLRGEKDD